MSLKTLDNLNFFSFSQTSVHLFFIFNDLEIFGLKSNTTFPGIENVLPQTYIATARLKREDLLNAIKLIRSVNPISSNPDAVSLNIEILQGEIILHLPESGYGTAKWSIPCELTGYISKCSVNLEYFRNAILCLSSQLIEIRLSQNISSALVVFANEQESTMQMIIPFRLAILP
jgi:DNA polymerase III sliding clamp (beta) subunit (PCNA family)